VFIFGLQSIINQNSFNVKINLTTGAGATVVCFAASDYFRFYYAIFKSYFTVFSFNVQFSDYNRAR